MGVASSNLPLQAPSNTETLTDVVQSTKQLKIGGFSVTSAMADGEVIKSRRWNVGRYGWEVQVVPKCRVCSYDYIALTLCFRSEVPADNNVKAVFSCQLIDPSGKLKPSDRSTVSGNFKRSGESACRVLLMTRVELQASGYLKDNAFTVECTITVLRELADKLTIGRPANDLGRPANDLVPSSGLHHHLGELLQQGTGADVTVIVSGESFVAHKVILASRSPVFMAEFFGHMKEKHSQRVEIKDMEAAVFRAMLHFIYTDSALELDGQDGMMVAQHLLVAADRYGIDRLKLICEDKLYDGINVDTAATTLALAQQHCCSLLKAKCVELIVANIEAVMETEGYKHLMASCPSVMNDLLKAVHGRKN